MNKDLNIALENLANQEAQTGPGHADLVPFLVEVSEAYQEEENYTEAYSFYKNAVTILTMHLTEIHPYLLPYFCDMIELEVKMENRRGALNYWEKTVLILQYFPDEGINEFVQAISSLALFMRGEGTSEKPKYYTLPISLLLKRNRKDDKTLIIFYDCLIKDYYNDDGSSEEFSKYINEYWRLNLLHFGEQSQEFVNACMLLSNNHDHRNEIKNAIVICKKALDIFTQISTEETLETVKICHKLAIYYEKAKELSKALEVRSKGLNILENILGKENSEMAKEYYEVANYHKELKNYNLGLKYLSNSIAANKKRKEPCNWILFNCYKTSAFIYCKKENFDQEIFFRQKAIGIMSPEGEDFHNSFSSVAVAYQHSCLGLAYRKIKRYNEAIECWNEAILLLLFEQGRERNYVRISNDYHNMGLTYYQMGRVKEAIEHWKKLLEIRREFETVTNLFCFPYYVNLAASFMQIERYTEAISYWKKIIQIAETETPEHVQPISSYYRDLSICYAHLRKYNDSITIIKKAIEMAEKDNEGDKRINSLKEIWNNIIVHREEYQNNTINQNNK